MELWIVSHALQRNRTTKPWWRHQMRYWPFVRGIHLSPVNSPHNGQWRGTLMLSLICARINGWVNNCEAGDLRRRCVHYDVTVTIQIGRVDANATHYIRLFIHHLIIRNSIARCMQGNNLYNRTLLFREWNTPETLGKFCTYSSRYQSSLGQQDVDLGPTGPRWDPCWPQELCYLGSETVACFTVTPYIDSTWLNWKTSSCRPIDLLSLS